MFRNISNFNKTTDYLYILNAVLFTDICVILLLIFDFIKSATLKQWYSKYNLSAVIADVLIIVIGIILTRFFYPYIFGTQFSLYKFIGLAVIIQIIHDLLFYYLFSAIPRGRNKILDSFKDYASEVGFKAVISDSAMVILSCLLASYFASLNLNKNIIILIVLIYMVPYLVYH